MTEAPGAPGIEPRWTSSAKDGVGTALSPRSAVWFTHSHGILNEIYYPAVDKACVRDCGLIVTDGTPGGFFAEEKRDTISTIDRLAPGVPLFTITNICRAQRFTIEKRIVADPMHDCVLQDIKLTPAPGVSGLKLFVLLAPHLVNGGAHNTGWLDGYKGAPMLMAAGGNSFLALASATGFLARGVGFVGVSDGWQILARHGRLAEIYETATNGNIALCAELDTSQPIHLAIGFGRTAETAAYQAAASLARGLTRAEAGYMANWQGWQAGLEPLDPPQACRHNYYRISTAVLRSHDSPLFPGGSIASLSIPWGGSKGDDDLGGYHLVWPRDLAETAGALLACGALTDARRTLDYLRVIQEPDGHWKQNSWLDGSAYWSGTQMDETGFPILLLDLAFRNGAVEESELPEYWPMVRNACGFIIANGPASDQDRWEENAGYTPATIAVEIAALLAAADIAERVHAPAALAAYLRDTADAWNADIESWMYVTGTDLAKRCNVSGYYLRVVAEGDRDLAAAPEHGRVAVRNRPAGEADIDTDALIGPDALALVRFGLRAANDPRILNTVKLIDHLTRVDLPQGPAWYRYNNDGYGEHGDGRPFDGTGHGRAWPLLIGERAHYAIAAGDLAQAAALRATIEGCTSEGGLLPEQVWDTADIPARELYRGRPSGSAMPLVWAHAEYIKLLRSLRDETIFDLPPHPVQRYLVQNTKPTCRDWRESWRRTRLPAGQILRVELTTAATIRYSTDNWASFTDVETQPTGFGDHFAPLPTARLPAGATIIFTWHDADGTWRGKNFSVGVVA